MLRTNSKAARNNIMAYIRGDIEYLTECYNYDVRNGGAQYDLNNDNELCAYIWGLFTEQKSWVINRYGTRDAFTDWAQGLALGNMFDYYIKPAIDILGDILEETPAERARYTETDAEKTMTYLIYREVMERAARAL